MFHGQVDFFECCECCAGGVDPDLHSDPEFEGHEIGCTLCSNYKRREVR